MADTTKSNSPVSPPDQKETKKKDRDWLDYVKFVLEVVGLVVLIVYTISTLGLWKESQTQSSMIQKHFDLDRRPYITIAGLQMINVKEGKSTVPIKGKPLEVNIVYANNGKSMALRCVVHRHLVFGRLHLAERVRPEPTDTNRETTTIFPGQPPLVTTVTSLKDTFANETATINPSEIVDWDGTGPIVIFGRITYEDDSGKKYCTPILSTYAGGSAMWGNITEIGSWETGTKRHIRDFCPPGTEF